MRAQNGDSCVSGNAKASEGVGMPRNELGYPVTGWDGAGAGWDGAGAGWDAPELTGMGHMV